MKFAFYFGHPAQFLFVRETIYRLHDLGHETLLLIKKKDVLENLIESSGLEYVNVLPVERKNSRFATMQSLVKRNRKMYPILKQFKPDLLISSDAAFAHLGTIMGIPRITVLEDDFDVIKPLAKVTYPFTSTILCPEVCDVGNYREKKVGYQGYMKLGYLHPNVFEPNAFVPAKYGMKEDYALIRLSRLAAYHDVNVKGLTENDLDNIIKTLKSKSIRPYISSEGEIPERFKEYNMTIDPVDIHHILAHAKMLVSDSQSMSVEAAVLGVPSLRYSGFVGRISVLEELEVNYSLTFGFQIGHQIELLQQLNNILEIPNFSEEFQNRRQLMLDEKINVSKFLTEFFIEYPNMSNDTDTEHAGVIEFHQESEQRA